MRRTLLAALCGFLLAAGAAMAQLPSVVTFQGTMTVPAATSTPLTAANVRMAPNMQLPDQITQLVVANVGANPVYVCWNGGTASASSGCELIPSGGSDYAAMASAGPVTFYSTSGTTIAFRSGPTNYNAPVTSGGAGGNVTIVGPLGQALMAASIPVVLPSDQTVATSSTPASVTGAAGTASAIVTGGSATTLITGPVKGCWVTNPITATDQNIATAEVAYVNIVTAATANGRGTNVRLDPGQTFYCPAGMTNSLSAIAATTSHAFSVTVW
jgi:hypothetical protein